MKNLTNVLTEIKAQIFVLNKRLTNLREQTATNSKKLDLALRQKEFSLIRIRSKELTEQAEEIQVVSHDLSVAIQALEFFQDHTNKHGTIENFPSQNVVKRHFPSAFSNYVIHSDDLGTILNESLFFALTLCDR